MNRLGDPRSRLGKLIAIGEDLWEGLLDLLEVHIGSVAAEPEEPGPGMCEQEAEEVAAEAV